MRGNEEHERQKCQRQTAEASKRALRVAFASLNILKQLRMNHFVLHIPDVQVGATSCRGFPGTRKVVVTVIRNINGNSTIKKP